MSVSMTRADGVTVFTLTSDPKSRWPPLCQILKGLCYSPVCCSVSQHLRSAQRASLSILGALHIMVGLLNIGFGVILTCSRGGSSWQMGETAFPYWLGGLFVFFGIICILSEKYPSPCLVIISVILNLCGVGLAIAAIVLYSINIANIWLWSMCSRDEYYWYRDSTPRPTQSPDEKYMEERCLEGKEMILMLLRSINAVLIVLSALEVCLVISSAVMGIKALRMSDNGGAKTLQITSGLINIGLGPGRIGFKPLDVASMGAAYWLGLVFITAGIISIVAARIKTPSVVKLATIMNRVEAAFALLSIVLYILDLRDNSVRRMCSRTTGGGGNCWVVANFAQRLLIFMDVTLILVSLLQVIVSRAFALIDSTSSTTETKMEEEHSRCLNAGWISPPQTPNLEQRTPITAVSVIKDKSVTMVTGAADSVWLLLCHILEGPCCRPACCSAHRGRMQTNATAALQTIQIMVGLFNIGLGLGRTSTHPGDLASLGAAYWLGAVFLAAGLLTLVSGCCPSACLVGLAVFLNIVAAIFAVTGIVLYAIDLGNSVALLCSYSQSGADADDDNCLMVAFLAQRLLTAMDITLIVLAVLQLCVSISLAVLGIKALIIGDKYEGDDDEGHEAVMKEVFLTFPGA
ncbi:uncharacterized protein ACBR49_005167 [Aulostomus maculatus]